MIEIGDVIKCKTKNNALGVVTAIVETDPDIENYVYFIGGNGISDYVIDSVVELFLECVSQVMQCN